MFTARAKCCTIGEDGHIVAQKMQCAAKVASTDQSEEGRRFLQLRLALMFKVGLILSGGFLVAVVATRGLFGASVADEIRSPSRITHLLATGVLAGAWLYLRTGTRKFSTLASVDAITCLLLCLLLDLQAALFHIRTVAVFNIVLTTGIALILRAVIVPSETRRTVLIGTCGVGLAVVSFFVSLLPAWPIRSSTGGLDWPVGYQLVSLLLWTISLAAVSVVASHVIYGLRREVRAAQKLGQYVLDRKLGQGGMGVVFRATHAMLRRETALKLLSPERIDALSLQRFEREVVQTARLSHPNTVAIYDYGRTPDGVFYYAMEYLDGLTLERLIEREGPLPPGRVVTIMAQVCASLDEAHSTGLVHRDIKPPNIMVMGHAGAWDLVKVLDFGLVKDMSPSKAQRPSDNGGRGAMMLSDPAFLLGTPQYMSPEAIGDPDKVGPASDLYGVAAVGYFLLTGTPVFLERAPIAVCAAHLDQTPESLSKRLGHPVPRDLEELLLKGLSKRPSDRPPTADAFRQELLACDVEKWTETEARRWWEKMKGALASYDEAEGNEDDCDAAGGVVAPSSATLSVSMVGRSLSAKTS